MSQYSPMLQIQTFSASQPHTLMPMMPPPQRMPGQDLYPPTQFRYYQPARTPDGGAGEEVMSAYGSVWAR